MGFSHWLKTSEPGLAITPQFMSKVFFLKSKKNQTFILTGEIYEFGELLTLSCKRVLTRILVKPKDV